MRLDLYQLQRRENEDADDNRQIYLVSIIITSAFLFISVIFVFVMLRRRRYKSPAWSEGDDEQSEDDGQAVMLLVQKQQQPDLIRSGTGEKMQLISRLNNYNGSALEHFVVQYDPVANSSNAHNIALNHKNNELPFNHSPMSNPVPPKLIPTSVLSVATATTATITSEDDSVDSEPEYAEPMINNAKSLPSTPSLRPMFRPSICALAETECKSYNPFDVIISCKETFLDTFSQTICLIRQNLASLFLI